jgi:L-type amino acid transporter 5
MDEVSSSLGISQKSASGQATNDGNDVPASYDPVRLKRRLGLWNGVAVIIGVIVGSGIFISPREVLADAGSIGASLLVWGICGVLSLMGALCMAELGTSIPDSGGDYSYIKMAYGDCTSFLYLWVTVLIILPASNALAALTFANYVIKPFFVDCDPPAQAVRLFAFAIIFILTWVNCYSVKWSIRLQNSFTLTKVIALVMVIVVGAYYIFAGKTDGRLTSDSVWQGEPITFVALAKAFYSGLYSYAGWNALNFVTEEIKNPIKNMPRAIIISITAITAIYVLVNISYFAVLTQNEIKGSSAIAVTFGERTLGPVSFIMPLSVALSTTSGLNALIFSSSRILFVGARQGQLFSLLNMISIKRLTPVPSLILVGFMSSLYLITTHISSLINYLIFIEASFGALGVSTVLVLRYKYPDTRRPLRVHTYIPVLYLILSALLIATPVVRSPIEALIGTIILITGIPVYYLTANWKVKPRIYQKTIDKLNTLTQKLTLSVPQEGELVE